MLLFIDDINMPMCFVLQHKNRKSQQEWPSENKQDAWNIMDYHCVTFAIKFNKGVIGLHYQYILTISYFHLKTEHFCLSFHLVKVWGKNLRQGCYPLAYLFNITMDILVEFPVFFWGGGKLECLISMRQVDPGSLVQTIRLTTKEKGSIDPSRICQRGSVSLICQRWKMNSIFLFQQPCSFKHCYAKLAHLRIWKCLRLEKYGAQPPIELLRQVQNFVRWKVLFLWSQGSLHYVKRLGHLLADSCKHPYVRLDLTRHRMCHQIWSWILRMRLHF